MPFLGGSVDFKEGPNIRIVFVHVDYVRYCTKKKAKTPEPISLKRDSMEEGVILFCCTEKIDEDNPHNIVGNATLEVIKRLEMIKAKKV